MDSEPDHLRDNNPGRGALGKSVFNGDAPAVPYLDQTFSERMSAVRHEFPEADVPFLEELLDYMADSGMLVGSRGAKASLLTESIDATRALNGKIRQMFHLLVSYQANQKTVADVRMSTRCLALELEYYTAAGADNVAELARLCRMKKQTVNKCAANFQSKGGLPPRTGQRGETARQNMSDSRNKQLATAASGDNE